MPLFILYVILSPCLWLSIRIFALFNNKLRNRIHLERKIYTAALAKIGQNRRDKTVIIFHAASCGEFEQLIPLLLQIDRTRFYIVQTFFSYTVFKKEQNSDLFDAVCYHPFDTPVAAYRFFKKINPRYYIVTRHDIWPIHLYTAKRMHIQTVLINANMYRESHRFHPLVIHFSRWIFNKFDLILCGSERIKTNLSLLTFASKIVITGDTRFEQVRLRRTNNNMNHFPVSIAYTKNIVLGSTIASDYPVIIQGLIQAFPGRSLRKHNIKVIFVPHEMKEKELQKLETILSDFGFQHSRYSSHEKKAFKDILIVDCVGILADLYAYAQLAYIGAGFGAGVHNVLEPAVYGCAIAYGPNYKILDEAVTLADKKLANIIHNNDDFARFIQLLYNPKKLLRTRAMVRDFAAMNTMSSEKILDSIFA